MLGNSTGWPNSESYSSHPVPFKIKSDGTAVIGYCLKFFDANGGSANRTYNDLCDLVFAYLNGSGITEERVYLYHLYIDPNTFAGVMGITFGMDSATGQKTFL